MYVYGHHIVLLASQYYSTTVLKLSRDSTRTSTPDLNHVNAAYY